MLLLQFGLSMEWKFMGYCPCAYFIELVAKSEYIHPGIFCCIYVSHGMRNLVGCIWQEWTKTIALDCID